MSIVEWCEGRVSRYEITNFISEHTNSLSNIAFLIAPLYSSGENPECDNAIRMIGLGSFIFHATESYFGQLLDEIPMSLLAYFYFQIVCKMANYGRIYNRLYSRTCLYNRIYLMTMLAVWIIYIKHKVYLLFVSFFFLQISLPIYIVSTKIRKTEKQKKALIKGSSCALFSVACWLYERHLYTDDNCPTDMLDFRYYLHSYWHFGMALAHYYFMVCIEQTGV